MRQRLVIEVEVPDEDSDPSAYFKPGSKLAYDSNFVHSGFEVYGEVLSCCTEDKELLSTYDPEQKRWIVADLSEERMGTLWRWAKGSEPQGCCR